MAQSTGSSKSSKLKPVAVEFETQKGEATAMTYEFNGRWYFGIHHTYQTPSGELGIGKGFAIAPTHVEGMLEAIVIAVNEAMGTHYSLTEGE